MFPGNVELLLTLGGLVVSFMYPGNELAVEKAKVAPFKKPGSVLEPVGSVMSSATSWDKISLKLSASTVPFPPMPPVTEQMLIESELKDPSVL